MRYLAPGRYDEEIVKTAESLFERFVGDVIAVRLYTETIPLKDGVGRLSHTPVARIETIRARVDAPHIAPWAIDSNIDVETVTEWEGVVSLPSSFFGDPFTHATVTYLAGYDEIPPDVVSCVEEIASLVRDGTVDEWSGISVLSDESQAVIAKYRRR